jgi:hypothetical protein
LKPWNPIDQTLHLPKRTPSITILHLQTHSIHKPTHNQLARGWTLGPLFLSFQPRIIIAKRHLEVIMSVETWFIVNPKSPQWQVHQ